MFQTVRIIAATFLFGALLFSYAARLSAKDQIPAACMKEPTEEKRLTCGIAYYRKSRMDSEAASAAARTDSAASKARTEEANRRSEESNRRSEEAQKVIESAKKSDQKVASAELCFSYIKKGIENKKFSRDDVLQFAGGKLSVDNTCATAAKFGYARVP